MTYRVKRLPLALAASFVAGNVSSLLGIGGGFIKVPVLNAWCGVPLRAAAATSAFMIGVTATAGAVIYYGHGARAGPCGRGGPRRADRLVVWACGSPPAWTAGGCAAAGVVLFVVAAMMYAGAR